MFVFQLERNILPSFVVQNLVMIEGTIEKDFWEQNPTAKYRDPFSTFFQSAKREVSSRIMWAIYLLEDPKSSYNNMLYEDRLNQIETNFLQGKISLTHKKVKPLVDAYKRMLMTKEELMYNVVEKKLEDYVVAIQGISMVDESGRREARMAIKEIDGMFKSFRNVQTEMLEKRKVWKMRGKRSMSKREQRLVDSKQGMDE